MGSLRKRFTRDQLSPTNCAERRSAVPTLAAPLTLHRRDFLKGLCANLRQTRRRGQTLLLLGGLHCDEFKTPFTNAEPFAAFRLVAQRGALYTQALPFGFSERNKFAFQQARLA